MVLLYSQHKALMPIVFNHLAISLPSCGALPIYAPPGQTTTAAVGLSESTKYGSRTGTFCPSSVKPYLLTPNFYHTITHFQENLLIHLRLQQPSVQQKLKQTYASHQISFGHLIIKGTAHPIRYLAVFCFVKLNGILKVPSR